jgi:hypothetical protein
MRHNRNEVIKRTIREFKLLDHLVARLSDEDWRRLVRRPETKDPWTVKDALVHITHWKADVTRSARRQPRPIEERGLNTSDGNHLVYVRWRHRSPQDVLAWHRQVQKDVLLALREAPDEWFNRTGRRAEWPFDLDGHSSNHRIKDIELALKQPRKRVPHKG